MARPLPTWQLLNGNLDLATNSVIKNQTVQPVSLSHGAVKRVVRRIDMSEDRVHAVPNPSQGGVHLQKMREFERLATFGDGLLAGCYSLRLRAV
jgi:hypothetical protein